MLYDSVNFFKNFLSFANACNPYHGLSSPFNTSLGGNFIGYEIFSVGVGQTPNFVGP